MNEVFSSESDWDKVLNEETSKMFMVTACLVRQYDISDRNRLVDSLVRVKVVSMYRTPVHTEPHHCRYVEVITWGVCTVYHWKFTLQNRFFTFKQYIFKNYSSNYFMTHFTVTMLKKYLFKIKKEKKLMPLLWSKFTSKAFLKTNNELKKTSSYGISKRSNASFKS